MVLEKEINSNSWRHKQAISSHSRPWLQATVISISRRLVADELWVVTWYTTAEDDGAG
jgi:hypothetical protein